MRSVGQGATAFAERGKGIDFSAILIHQFPCQIGPPLVSTEPMAGSQQRRRRIGTGRSVGLLDSESRIDEARQVFHEVEPFVRVTLTTTRPAISAFSHGRA